MYKILFKPLPRVQRSSKMERNVRWSSVIPGRCYLKHTLLEIVKCLQQHKKHSNGAGIWPSN